MSERRYSEFAGTREARSRLILPALRALLAFIAVVLCAMSAEATDVLFNLSEFNAVPASNRVFSVQQLQPIAGNLNYYMSDTNGQYTLLNMPIADYAVVIRATNGAASIAFQMTVTATNLGQVDALNITSLGSIQTYPQSAKSAWTIQASDKRYQLSGTTLSNTFYPLFSNPSNYAHASDVLTGDTSSTNFALGVGLGATNLAQALAASLSNLVYVVGGNDTNNTAAQFLTAQSFAQLQGTLGSNYALGLSIAGTNFALTIGQNGTNYTLLVGLGNTNFTLAVGLGATNLSFLIGQNGTNFTLLTGQSITNFVNTNGVNATNFGYLMGQQGTNFTLLTGLGSSNLSYLIGQNGTNFTALTATSLTNLIGTNGIWSTNFAYQIGSQVTNFSLIISNWAFMYSTNGTNFAYGLGQQGTNFGYLLGQNGTNFALGVGLGATNLANSIFLSLSNLIGTNGINSTNAGQLYAFLQGVANTNNDMLLSNALANYANTNSAGQVSVLSNFYLAKFIAQTNGSADSAVFWTSLGMGGSTNYLQGSTNIIGVSLSIMAGVNGTFKLLSGSLWTNTAVGSLPGFDVSLASGIYSVRSNKVTLFTLTNSLPGILQPSAQGVGNGVMYYGFYHQHNGEVDIGVWDNSNAVAYFNGQLLSVSNFFATNFVTGPLQASNLQGSFLANLLFTNGNAGQVFESDGNGGWMWSNTVPIAVTASNIPSGSPGWLTMSNLALQVAGPAGASNWIANINGVGSNTTLYFPSLYQSTLTDFLNVNSKNITNLNLLFFAPPLGTQPSVVTMSSEQNVGRGGINIGYNNGQIYNEFYDATLGGASNDISANTTGSSILGGMNNYIGTGGSGSADHSTIVGGVSNNIAATEAYSFLSGFMGQVSHSGVWMWADYQPGLTSFQSTGTNQFLIRAAGGVGINTNNPGTNGLRVFGTVDASAFTQNGTPFEAGATNLTPWTSDINAAGFSLTNAQNISSVTVTGVTVDAANLLVGGTNVYSIVTASTGIAQSSGHGTNTTLVTPTLDFVYTNYVWTNSVITISGSGDSTVNGTYTLDPSRSDAAFNTFSNYVATTAYFSQLFPAMQTFTPTLLWTNGSGNTASNFFIAFFPSYSWQTNVIFLDSPTNTCHPAPYQTTWDQVGGLWPIGTTCWGTGGGDTVVGAGVANPTNLIPTTFYAANGFTPIVHDFVPDNVSLHYAYKHGLGHTPHLVQWYYHCINFDAGSLFQPGDDVEFWSFINDSRTVGKNATNVWMDVGGVIVGTGGFNGFYSFTPKGGGAATGSLNFTNWLIRVEIYP